MRVANRYPAGTAGGGCFITKRSALGDGERVIDLQIDLEDLPGWGLLCINEGAVRVMARELGLDIMDADAVKRRKAERNRLDNLRNENKVLHAALAHIVESAREVGLGHLLEEADEELVDA